MTRDTRHSSHDSYHELNQSWLISRTQWVILTSHDFMTRDTRLSCHDSYHELDESCLQSCTWHDSFICVTGLISRTANTLQHTATHCSTLQHIAAHCNTLQHTATCCTCQGAMSHIPFSYVTHTSRIHVTHLNESCLRRVHRRATWSQSATSPISAQWMHHVSAQFSESRLCTVEESCHTSERVMSHIWTSHVTTESIGGRHGHSQQLSWHDSNHELNESCLQSRMWYDSFICVTWLISQTQRVMSPQSLSAGDMVTVSNYRDMTQITNSTSHVSAESIGGRHGHSQQRPRRCMQKGECAPHRPHQQVKALNTWIDPKTRKDLNTWKQTSKHEKRPLNLQRRVCPTLSVSAGKSP